MDKIKVTQIAENILKCVVCPENAEGDVEELGTALMSVLGGVIVSSAIQITNDPAQRIIVARSASQMFYNYLNGMVDQMLEKEA